MALVAGGPALAVHGGAGRVEASGWDDRVAGVVRARDAAWARLEQGGSALDAVLEAVRRLEDDPLFNAGTGAALNRDGFAELDAAVMDGVNLGFGAVAAVRDVKNPVLLAAEVLRSEHVLLVGEGASRFARERGIPACDPGELVTERQRRRWSQARRRALEERSGTVGAVALDAEGRLAAATSTGGMVDQRVGRVGDTPLPGAGTYAEAGLGAVSATGYGEYFARALAAYRAASALREAPPDRAVRAALEAVARLGGAGGLILVDAQGRLAWHHTTPEMSVAWRTPAGEGAQIAPGA
ncbi:isoaspartyl peptidase/L-asparaginase family protein [Oceanithermus sp.]|uniref:isoaspartyl peptidase/L-asparaginase family protein n=1 Tax=Oceanithermus sp. TaxID=2268145 RepID=UPI00257CC3D6|nr:isoaspartyl peptidase/L-asparaginase family protein [Oceanithermus sp.]